MFDCSYSYPEDVYFLSAEPHVTEVTPFPLLDDNSRLPPDKAPITLPTECAGMSHVDCDGCRSREPSRYTEETTHAVPLDHGDIALSSCASRMVRAETTEWLLPTGETGANEPLLHGVDPECLTETREDPSDVSSILDTLDKA